MEETARKKEIREAIAAGEKALTCLLYTSENDMNAFLEKNPDVKREDIPADMLTASGSGLDPHISPASAKIQISRIAEASGLTEETIEAIVEENTEGKFLGIFGEETVNAVSYTHLGGSGETLVLNANHPLVQYVLANKEGENTEKICEQLYDLASLSHGQLSPERMTAFVARSNEIMLLMAGEKKD